MSPRRSSASSGAAAAQLGGATGPAWSATGLLLSAGALIGAAGTSLLAAPVLPRLGALAVTIWACGMAGILLLAAAAAIKAAGGPPILRTPTVTELAALSYLAVAVTAVVFLAWYGAMRRLGVDRTGLFNGLIPIASLGAVALVGTGTIEPVQCLAALTVLVGVMIGLGRNRQVSRETVAKTGQGDNAPIEAWRQLSPQELQIARLWAEGLSNGEIGERPYLSDRTIGTHFYNLFPKLGITSRAQLRDALE
jgi:DNA-binding CsgD family transcriptional regulator